jgi:uracil-DNA glycosylase
VVRCKRCGELVANRTQTVFGVGDPHARLVFLGEAPGADEDQQGEPFVGRAGQLLNDIITKGLKMRREDVYILNVLKCRPPDNRTPAPDEAANCREFLDAQLEVLRPPFICCLGAVAAQNLLGTTESIGRLRGRVHEYRGAKVVCTYHPAYLLRNPAAKRDTWEDLKLLMREMGLG